MDVNARLWSLQVILAAVAAFGAAVHFVMPPGLPAPLEWMYALPAPVHYVAGAAEGLAALGLVLPTLTGIKPGLTPLAALGLAVVMLGAVVFHVPRGEGLNVLVNAIVASLGLVVAYGRRGVSAPTSI